MTRTTGHYQTTTLEGETVRAFEPLPLSPAGPALRLEGSLARFEALRRKGRGERFSAGFAHALRRAFVKQGLPG